MNVLHPYKDFPFLLGQILAIIYDSIQEKKNGKEFYLQSNKNQKQNSGIGKKTEILAYHLFIHSE